MAGKNTKKRIILYPYKIGSKSCDDIVRALRSKSEYKVFRVFPDRNFSSRINDIIINWGNSTRPGWNVYDILNHPSAVKVAVNKLSTLRALGSAGVSHVPFCTDPKDTIDWDITVVRKVLTGHSGEGIEMVTNGSKMPQARLYTEYIPKSVEYRVHVFKGKVIDYTKKIKRTDEGIKSRVKDDLIRSNTLGWEFIRDVAPRDSVKQLAIDAVGALGLDFGSVDIIRSKRVNYVLEVGTACGLSPIGVESYSNAIIELL